MNFRNCFETFKDDKDIAAFVDELMEKTKDLGKPMELFWQRGERALLNSVLSYIFNYETNPEKRNMSGVKEMIEKSFTHRDLGGKSHFEMIYNGTKECFPDFSDSFCYREYKIFEATGDRSKLILISALARLESIDGLMVA